MTTKIVEGIKEALSKYSTQELLSGTEVRDTLLDLLQLATHDSETTEEGLVRPLKIEKL